MSPLLFLAIAVAVPLLGMLVLGLGARIKRGKVTDDQTGLFRRRMESLAPPERPGAAGESPSTPGLMGAMRRRRSGRAAAPSQGAVAAGDELAPPSSPARQPAPVRVRLVAHAYSGPQLPPVSASLEELPPLPEPMPRVRPRPAFDEQRPPTAGPRRRRAHPRPPGLAVPREPVNSSDQRRRSGS